MPKPELTAGYWYVRTTSPTRYTVVSVMVNQLSDERELLVFQFDETGSTDPAEFDFIGPVPAPEFT